MHPLCTIARQLSRELSKLPAAPPVTHVYNPLQYAFSGYSRYVEQYAGLKAKTIMVGMNPGPWGMAQTGVPFGEIDAVSQWMNIHADISQPDIIHPSRPVDGFACTRHEVSGKRLWGWARDTFGTPERFFSQFFVVNYCPLIFYDTTGKNITPDKLTAQYRKAVYTECDRALRDTVQWFEADTIIGIGAFACKRAQAACKDYPAHIFSITHPSPANPKANRGWAACIMDELKENRIDPA